MATEAEILDALKKAREQRAEGGNFPDRVKWDEPKIVVGTVKSFSTFESKYGPSRSMVVTKKDGVDVNVIVSSPVALAGQIERLNPQPGDSLAIEFEGEKVGKSGTRYKSFTVARIGSAVTPKITAPVIPAPAASTPGTVTVGGVTVARPPKFA